MDREQLADFLRRRREALQPEDVGLARGARRRTDGLRREEVAALTGMSVDYYGRLEQQRGPQPSEQMLGALARALRLSIDERDHLFRLAGHNAPARLARGDHVSPGVMRIVDRLADSPVEVLSSAGETLVQTPLAATLLGDASPRTGLARATVYRWFTDPSSQTMYPEEDRPRHARAFVADLRVAAARDGRGSRAAEVAEALLPRSPEFAALWAQHEVEVHHPPEKRLQHPEVGVLHLQCQILVDPAQWQTVLVFTATPGSESAEKLALLAVLGRERLGAG